MEKKFNWRPVASITGVISLADMNSASRDETMRYEILAIRPVRLIGVTAFEAHPFP